jgi:hypothetical protein
MEFLHASIALLASMVLVLAGMVGWLYWQQTRLFQNMNSMVMVIGELARPEHRRDTHEVHETPEEADIKPTSDETVPEPVKEEDEEGEDDRATVEPDAAVKKVDTVEGPPEPIDLDALGSKSTKEIRELLSKRGIPFGPRDSKSALISLLKAVA